MKICIATTQIRPVPTYFPPFGSLAIIQSLRGIGEDAEFYNIDYHRYAESEIESYFKEKQFDVVGISSVVSTAYAYTKFLAGLIRRVSPNTVIVVGGNLAASAEILLRKSSVDFCMTGDGEIIIRELITALREGKLDDEHLRKIKGICFLESDGSFNFTGYGAKPTAAEVEDPDYTILEKDGSISHYLPEVADNRFDSIEGKSFGKGVSATVVMTKGCVSRCTFCHRWEKGYRALPPANVVNHVKFLIERYNIRYIDLADENFGSDRAQAMELARCMGELGLRWRAGGVRSSTVNPETLKHWKENGCVNVTYGTESGSRAMLKIMEKKITVEQNMNALKWTYEAGMRSVIQIILGMPGETDETVQESIEFLNEASNYLYLGDNFPSSMISLNYAQALPGTPLYEYARQHGFIGKSMDEEEQYLLRISDTDAYKEDHFVNYTGFPLLKVLMWQQDILAKVDANYLQRKYNYQLSLLGVIKFYFQLIVSRLRKQTVQASSGKGYTEESGYYNFREAGKFTSLLLNPVTKFLFHPFLALGMAFGRKHERSGFVLIADYLWWSVKHLFVSSRNDALPTESLRKVTTIKSSMEDSKSDKMIPLRQGR